MYNLKQTGRPAYISAAKTGKHSDVVWQVMMNEYYNDIDDYDDFMMNMMLMMIMMMNDEYDAYDDHEEDVML